jgi:hypothetical protein
MQTIRFLDIVILLESWSGGCACGAERYQCRHKRASIPPALFEIVGVAAELKPE